MIDSKDWKQEGREHWSCQGYAITANKKPAGIRYTAWCPGERTDKLIVIGYYWKPDQARDACINHFASHASKAK